MQIPRKMQNNKDLSRKQDREEIKCLKSQKVKKRGSDDADRR